MCIRCITICFCILYSNSFVVFFNETAPTASYTYGHPLSRHDALPISLLGYLLFRKVGKFDPVTSFVSATPGGLQEMTVIGEHYGGDARHIVLKIGRAHV